MSKKIFLVDDDEGILGAVVMVLEDAGFQVHVSSNGDAVLQQIQSFQPDLILLDMLLSGSDGRKIAVRLKQDEATREIPIIMISAHPRAKESAKTSGADDFLAKPFEIHQLLEKINTYIK